MLTQTDDAHYQPYTGETRTLTLPHTVCGGEVDATGEGLETWKLIVADGSTLKFESPNPKYWDLMPRHSAPGIVSDSRLIMSSHFPAGLLSSNGKYEFVTVVAENIKIYFDTPEALNRYLATQYAAGTPVTIAYDLATPTPFTATGGGTIAAIEGVNTIMTDADSLTVTGLKDPRAAVKKLEDRVAALENATATNTLRGVKYENNF